MYAILWTLASNFSLHLKLFCEAVCQCKFAKGKQGIDVALVLPEGMDEPCPRNKFKPVRDSLLQQRLICHQEQANDELLPLWSTECRLQFHHEAATLEVTSAKFCLQTCLCSVAASARVGIQRACRDGLTRAIWTAWLQDHKANQHTKLVTKPLQALCIVLLLCRLKLQMWVLLLLLFLQSCYCKLAAAWCRSISTIQTHQHQG